MKVEEFKEISNLLERVIHKYVQLEKRALDYGNCIILSQPEIQTIMLIGSNPGISVTAIAKMRGITKGTASQMLYKLVDKGLVKSVFPNILMRKSACFLLSLDRRKAACRMLTINRKYSQSFSICLSSHHRQ